MIIDIKVDTQTCWTITATFGFRASREGLVKVHRRVASLQRARDRSRSGIIVCVAKTRRTKLRRSSHIEMHAMPICGSLGSFARSRAAGVENIYIFLPREDWFE